MSEAKHKAGGCKTRAFTLLEIVLVLAIISVVSAIAVPRFASASARYKANAAAHRIVADMELAKARAYSTSASVEVRFDANDHTVSIPAIASFDDANASYVTDLSEEPFQAELSEVDFEGDTKVTFDIYGQPNADGEIVVQVGDTQKTIIIDRTTGEVRIDD